MAGIAAKSDDAVLVTTADRLNNARAILADYRQVGGALWPRFTGRRNGTLWYFRALSDALSARAPGPLTRELARTVDALARASA